MRPEETWRMTEHQQWISLVVVMVVVFLVVSGVLLMVRDARRDHDIEQWTDEFIPDSHDMVMADLIRDRMQARRKRR